MSLLPRIPAKPRPTRTLRARTTHRAPFRAHLRCHLPARHHHHAASLSHTPFAHLHAHLPTHHTPTCLHCTTPFTHRAPRNEMKEMKKRERERERKKKQFIPACLPLSRGTTALLPIPSSYAAFYLPTTTLRALAWRSLGNRLKLCWLAFNVQEGSTPTHTPPLLPTPNMPVTRITCNAPFRCGFIAVLHYRLHGWGRDIQFSLTPPAYARQTRTARDGHAATTPPRPTACDPTGGRTSATPHGRWDGSL